MRNIYKDYGCGWYIVTILAALVIAFGITCFTAWIVMLLWNAVIPIFWATAPKLTFWISFGAICLLDIVGSLLFKRGGNRRD